MARRRNRVVWFAVVAVILIILVIVATNQKPDYISKKTDRPFWGTASTTLEIVEYSDFSCPACQSAEAMVKVLKERWANKIKFSYRHFPLIGLIGHEGSLSAAEAAECAYEQDQFWPYHDLLFANQPAFSQDSLLRYARQLNLNETEFSQCLASRVKAEVVKGDREEGLAKTVDATPTFFLNGEAVADWRTLPQKVGEILGEKLPIQ